MVLTGNDLAITINSVDYTNSIIEANEINTDTKDFKTIKCFSNTYKKILKGRSEISLSFKMIVNGTNVSSLFESDTAITITIAGTGLVITYTNMIADSLTYEPVKDGVLYATLTYKAPAYDELGAAYNRVVTTS